MPTQSHRTPESEQTKAFATKGLEALAFRPRMEQVIKLVRTYRLAAGLAERLRLAEEIFRQIEPDLRFFVFGAIRFPAAEDVLQEVLKSIASSMAKFGGSSKEEFWAWCYKIARNRLNDHFRKKASDRLQPMPPEEIWQLVEASSQDAPITAGDRHDLEYAMNLLTASKPECRDYVEAFCLLPRLR
jgi:DNA-directed RNA polymerase specialized sigma24 family protein